MGRIERLLIVIFVVSLLSAVVGFISQVVYEGNEECPYPANSGECDDWDGYDDLSGAAGGFYTISGILGVIFLWGLILNSAYGTKAKATALRKSAMVDLESNQLLSAKIKFQELGEHNIVQEINATLNKQSSPHDKSIQNQVQNITITNITDSAMSGDINVMGTKKDNN
jgi:hypothetical protein